MEVKINKDIREFSESIFFGLSTDSKPVKHDMMAALRSQADSMESYFP